MKKSVSELVNGLRDKDATHAYECLKLLLVESGSSDSVYAHFDEFSDMLDDSNSYIRTRAIRLISSNAQWDTENKIDEIINRYLQHIADDKPITARQCIKALPEIAKRKPELVNDIRFALQGANLISYSDSMAALVAKDISAAIKEIG
ncbi:MAG: hypothetical protein FWG25_00765 [Promicromonosporaceae bacterium]|nr:hypothetical protein [Promicromonosporaceae bacterium]